MAIVQHNLGPADHGRSLSRDEFEDADFTSGFKHEIIDERRSGSSEPDPTANELELWLIEKFWDSSRAVGVLNRVTKKGRVCIHARPDDTVPEPDFAAITDYPLDRRFTGTWWSDVRPVRVCEVLVGDPQMDLGRNVELYLAVPSIREYWVHNGRDEPNEPTPIRHRRFG